MFINYIEQTISTSLCINIFRISTSLGVNIYYIKIYIILNNNTYNVTYEHKM